MIDVIKIHYLHMFSKFFNSSFETEYSAPGDNWTTEKKRKGEESMRWLMENFPSLAGLPNLANSTPAGSSASTVAAPQTSDLTNETKTKKKKKNSKKTKQDKSKKRTGRRLSLAKSTSVSHSPAADSS